MPDRYTEWLAEWTRSPSVVPRSRVEWAKGWRAGAPAYRGRGACLPRPGRPSCPGASLSRGLYALVEAPDAQPVAGYT